MAARTGKEYIESLRDDRNVWVGNKKVDTANYDKFAGSISGMAGYYDWQNKFSEDCLVEDDETGEIMNASLIVPKNRQDLDKRHRAYDRLSKYSYGMLGRTPDYCNTALCGMIARKDLFESSDKRFYENMVNFRKEVIAGDLSMTHAIVNADIDKSIDPCLGQNAELGMRVVDRTKNGLIVSGARILATLAPFSNELFVYPARPIPKDKPEYAVAFSIPMDTKGLITICRDHYGVDDSVTDMPFSSRFDEQDAYMIFNEVEIPWERVFIDGDIGINNSIAPGMFPGNMSQQTAIRALNKLKFGYDLCQEIAKITNSENYPPVAQALGEIYSYITVTKSMIHSAEERAYDYGAGAFFLHEDLNILRTIMPPWMLRINEIIEDLGAHHLLCTPSMELFKNSEISSDLEKYLPGANDISAQHRTMIMRLAWDFAGSALGARVSLYERYYLGSRSRNLIIDNMRARHKEQWGQVKEFLRDSGIKY